MKLPKYESLYVMFSPFNLPWRAKIGISKDHDIRKSEIEYSIKTNLGMTVKLRHFALPVLFARQNEKFLHWILQGLRYRRMGNTSGKTEWFISVNFITFAIAFLWMWWHGVDAAHWKAFALLILPAPIDHFILVLVLCIVQFAVVIAAFYLLTSMLW